ncbi:hypothetical protein [Deinococcus multiflagellatus]|uniref:Uncharacterized protein n=1 Tax=Deinococcus multiflagellatus TaxID=1656887 RepID=A0ABW1ZFR8_9DEIO|nr:hypothetical protein [Deinococcus multiflagellatus]MBZ9712860.1 hypothetical protein [Deinococcus multiflagellatus]
MTRLPGRPTIVCLCGSVRFLAEFDAASLAETLAGRIVLSVGSHRQRDEEAFSHLSAGERAAALDRLVELHRHKIDLADEILVINPGGYVGHHTQQEIDYARALGKRVRWLEETG